MQKQKQYTMQPTPVADEMGPRIRFTCVWRVEQELSKKNIHQNHVRDDFQEFEAFCHLLKKVHEGNKHAKSCV